jgi:hypothetical protein
MPIEWSVNILRLSVFSSGPIAASESDWRMLTGQEEAPARNAIPGGKHYSGPHLGGQLSLVVQGERIDVVLQAGDRSEGTELKLPVVGALQEVEHNFVDAATYWLRQISFPAVRLAFGAVLMVEQPSLTAAYETLRSLIKSVNINPERMRDLVYRINWPCQSTVLQLPLNRITTWTALRIVTRLVQMTGETMSVAPGEGELHAVRLEIDHSTDVLNRTPFEQGKLVPIFEELLAHAHQNAEEGEVQ